MSVKMLKTLSILVLFIGLSLTTIIGVGAASDSIVINPNTLSTSILNSINITLFFSMLFLGLSYIINGPTEVSLVSAITIATTLRFMIGVHICILCAIIGLQIVEYGINTVSDIGALLWPIFVVSFFAISLYVLANKIAEKAGSKVYDKAKSAKKQPAATEA